MAVVDLEGDPSEGAGKIGIVVSKWNSFITDKLLEGALDILNKKGYSDQDIVVVRCPGAYEIPSAASRLLPKVDGIITLGAVIRGETPHFDYVCDAVNRGVTDLNLNTGKPVTFGVLTTDTAQQASQRADAESSKGNKGAEAALACLEMLSLHRKIDNL
ncbi:MAG: 6,7-dimethyl-8-ribityllumazine synthase [Balneolaceae bacterium]|nr:6,7-dimethyl-8-ribityllumazine synthase [Balneolaceae bacterium]